MNESVVGLIRNQVIIYTVFAFFPLLRGCLTYQSPFSWSMACTAQIITIRSLTAASTTKPAAAVQATTPYPSRLVPHTGASIVAPGGGGGSGARGVGVASAAAMALASAFASGNKISAKAVAKYGRVAVRAKSQKHLKGVSGPLSPGGQNLLSPSGVRDRGGSGDSKDGTAPHSDEFRFMRSASQPRMRDSDAASPQNKRLGFTRASNASTAMIGGGGVGIGFAVADSENATPAILSPPQQTSTLVRVGVGSTPHHNTQFTFTRGGGGTATTTTGTGTGTNTTFGALSPGRSGGAGGSDPPSRIDSPTNETTVNRPLLLTITSPTTGAGVSGGVGGGGGTIHSGRTPNAAANASAAVQPPVPPPPIAFAPLGTLVNDSALNTPTVETPTTAAATIAMAAREQIHTHALANGTSAAPATTTSASNPLSRQHLY